MDLPVMLGADAVEVIAAAVVADMEARGLAVVGPDRSRPFGVAELMEETMLSDSAVRRMVEAGIFLRVAHTKKVLVTVESVRRWQGGAK